MDLSKIEYNAIASIKSMIIDEILGYILGFDTIFNKKQKNPREFIGLFTIFRATQGVTLDLHKKSMIIDLLDELGSYF